MPRARKLGRSVCHKDAAPGHCDGCDNDDRPVKPYDVTFTNGTTERCNYCDDCAGLAAMNYNGETAAIHPAEWHKEPWPCGHNDPIFVNDDAQRCAICGAERTNPSKEA